MALHVNHGTVWQASSVVGWFLLTCRAAVCRMEQKRSTSCFHAGPAVTTHFFRSPAVLLGLTLGSSDLQRLPARKRGESSSGSLAQPKTARPQRPPAMDRKRFALGRHRRDPTREGAANVPPCAAAPPPRHPPLLPRFARLQPPATFRRLPLPLPADTADCSPLAKSVPAFSAEALHDEQLREWGHAPRASAAAPDTIPALHPGPAPRPQEQVPAGSAWNPWGGEARPALWLPSPAHAHAHCLLALWREAALGSLCLQHPHAPPCAPCMQSTRRSPRRCRRGAWWPTAPRHPGSSLSWALGGPLPASGSTSSGRRRRSGGLRSSSGRQAAALEQRRRRWGGRSSLSAVS